MPDDAFLHILFFAVAAIGGAINAVAGGGSFLLFPILMFGGLSPVAANVMCSVALWPGSIASSYAYWREIKTPVATLKILLPLCALGSALGAALLLYFPEQVFAALVPWLLLAATLIFTFGGTLITRLRMAHLSPPPFLIYTMMTIIAIYGGYFGAGIGILMLAMLQLAGHSHMHAMSGLKTLLGAAINAVAVIWFVASGSVIWSSAGALIAGGITGGYLGTRLALKVSPEQVRRLVILIAWAMTAYFFIA